MKTVAQAVIIIILFLGFSGMGYFADGETTSSSGFGGPLPWITQEDHDPYQFKPLNLTLNLVLIALLSEIAVFGDSRIKQVYKKTRL